MVAYTKPQKGKKWKAKRRERSDLVYLFHILLREEEGNVLHILQILVMKDHFWDRFRRLEGEIWKGCE